jgi:flagellar biosynthesis chaperone FliJ
MNEELLLVVQGWNLEQLNAYIEQLEERVKNTSTLISQLRKIRRTKEKRKYTPENGPRGGK